MNHVLFLALFSLLTLSLFAQKPCSGEAYRQFDFWVGEWDVYDTSGDTLVGYNDVKLLLNGCLIEENWTGATGFVGKSFNTYNAVDSSWNQVWVDGAGSTLHFSGKYKDHVMDMHGSFKSKKGTTLFQLTFTHDPVKNTIRQQWKQSSDGGAKWAPLFDGTYKKRISKK